MSRIEQPSLPMQEVNPSDVSMLIPDSAGVSSVSVQFGSAEEHRAEPSAAWKARVIGEFPRCLPAQTRNLPRSG
jgi:hypothetical protein